MYLRWIRGHFHQPIDRQLNVARCLVYSNFCIINILLIMPVVVLWYIWQKLLMKCWGNWPRSKLSKTIPENPVPINPVPVYSVPVYPVPVYPVPVYPVPVYPVPESFKFSCFSCKPSIAHMSFNKNTLKVITLHNFFSLPGPCFPQFYVPRARFSRASVFQHFSNSVFLFRISLSADISSIFVEYLEIALIKEHYKDVVSKVLLFCYCVAIH